MAAPKRTKRKKHTTEVVDMPQMPFEEAIKRMLNAPPQHKTAKRQRSKSKRS